MARAGAGPVHRSAGSAAAAPGLLPLGVAAFGVFGVVLVLVGANQAELARALGLDLTRSGLLGAALSGGLGAGVTGIGPLVDRLPRRPLFLGATLLAGTSCLLVGPEVGFAGAVVLLALLGVGVGAYDTLLNALAVEVHGRSATGPLAVLHGAATLGAALGPFAIGALAARGGFEASFRATGALLLLLSVAVAAVRLPPPPPRATSGIGGDLRRVFGPALAALALVSFAYVGVETSLTLLAVPYASLDLGLGPDRGRLAISAFWFGLFLGRLALLLLARPVTGVDLALAGAAGGVLLATGIALEVRLLEAVTFGTGLSLGCVYPVMIALAGRAFPQARGLATGLVAGTGAAGGFAWPWFTGWLGDLAGPAVAVGSLVAGCAGIALAGVWFARRE